MNIFRLYSRQQLAELPKCQQDPRQGIGAVISMHFLQNVLCNTLACAFLQLVGVLQLELGKENLRNARSEITASDSIVCKMYEEVLSRLTSLSSSPSFSSFSPKEEAFERNNQKPRATT